MERPYATNSHTSGIRRTIVAVRGWNRPALGWEGVTYMQISHRSGTVPAVSISKAT